MNTTERAARDSWLLFVAAFGLLVPNGLFLYWAAREFTGIRAVFDNHLAVAFIVDALLATVVLAYAMATRPNAPMRWTRFVALSLLGGLGFSVPLSYWLERRRMVHRT